MAQQEWPVHVCEEEKPMNQAMNVIANARRDLVMAVKVRCEWGLTKDPSGMVYRTYSEHDEELYLSGATREEMEARVRCFYPHATFDYSACPQTLMAARADL